MPLPYSWRAPEALRADTSVYRSLSTPLYLLAVIEDVVPRYSRRLERYGSGLDPFAFAEDEAREVVRFLEACIKYRQVAFDVFGHMLLARREFTRREKLEDAIHARCAALLAGHGVTGVPLDPVIGRPRVVLERTRAALLPRVPAELEDIAREVQEHRALHLETARVQRRRHAHAATVEKVADLAEKLEPTLIVVLGGNPAVHVPRSAPGEPDLGRFLVSTWVQPRLAGALYVLGRADAVIARNAPADAAHLPALRAHRARVASMVERTTQDLAPHMVALAHHHAVGSFRALSKRIRERLPEAFKGFRKSDDAEKDAAEVWSRLERIDSQPARDASGHVLHAMTALAATRVPPSAPRPADARPPLADTEGFAAVDALHDLFEDIEDVERAAS